jgi:gliding motility-associated-like protein
LQIDTIEGGTGPYSYQLDDNSELTVTGFPLRVPNLQAGSYELEIQDANGCTFAESLTVPTPNELIVRIGPDTIINLGQTVQLDPLLSFEPASWQWTPSRGLSNDTLLQPLAAPQETVEYILTVTDEFGCTVSDAILLRVNRDIPIFVPSAFSPNNDGNNDQLVIFGSAAVAEIESLIILDRWGSQVYEVGGFAPNDVNAAWDGTNRGEPLNAGVFVYLLTYRLVNGEVMQTAGEVLLLR